MRLHWPLVAIATLFIAPAIGAVVLLKYMDYFKITSAAHGTLINPPQPISSYIAPHKWNLIYVQPEICDQICNSHAQELQKLQLALGADSNRVTVLTASQKMLIKDIAPNNILIIDPNGLYIMNYDANGSYSGLLKDMRRLLKYSHAS